MSLYPLQPGRQQLGGPSVQPGYPGPAEVLPSYAGDIVTGGLGTALLLTGGLTSGPAVPLTGDLVTLGLGSAFLLTGGLNAGGVVVPLTGDIVTGGLGTAFFLTGGLNPSYATIPHWVLFSVMTPIQVV